MKYNTTITSDNFLKEVKKKRLSKKWYYFIGIVDGKNVSIKGIGNWLQILSINGIDNSNCMGQNVGQFNNHLKSIFTKEV